MTSYETWYNRISEAWEERRMERVPNQDANQLFESNNLCTLYAGRADGSIWGVTQDDKVFLVKQADEPSIVPRSDS